MKRLAFVAVAVAVLLAACGGSSKPTSSPKKKTKPTSHSAAKKTTAPKSQSINMNVGNPSSAVTLSEAGSSLLYPYLQTLAPQLHSAYSNITLNPAAGGSGLGITNATNGTSDLGGSDAYLTPLEAQAKPSLENIPVAVSSQEVDYNLPTVKNLKLNGNVLAQIYQGKITTWNNSAIASLNPGVTLPSTKIVPIHRVDSSGDTFLFTGFLSATNPTWAKSPGQGTSITWPNVPGALTGNGNPGMVQACHSTPGCVAYIGISAQASAVQDGLQAAELQNKAGNYETWSTTGVTDAVNANISKVQSSLAANLLYGSGADSWPIVNFEYLVVNTQQSDSNTAQAIRTFLAWAINTSGGSTAANLAANKFVPLPSSVIPKVQAKIAKIGS